MFDIGIISFSGKLPSNLESATIGAPSLVTGGREVILAGYGLAKQEDDSTVGPLRQVHVKIGKIAPDDRLIYLESNTGKGGCNGDSGGPSFVDDRGTLKVIGATSGPGPTMEEIPCDKGHGTYTDITLYQGWMKKTFAAQNNPLTTLADDSSDKEFTGAGDTPRPPIEAVGSHLQADAKKWCDPSVKTRCFNYCTNGSDTGRGFGYQSELGGSCKVR